MYELSGASQSVVKLIHASPILTANTRIIAVPLPAVLWPQCQCPVGLGWRWPNRLGSGSTRQSCAAQVSRQRAGKSLPAQARLYICERWGMNKPPDPILSKQIVSTWKDRFVSNPLAVNFMLCHQGKCFLFSISQALGTLSRSMSVCPSVRTPSMSSRRRVRGEAENQPAWTPRPASQPSPAPLDHTATLLVKLTFFINPTSWWAAAVISMHNIWICYLKIQDLVCFFLPLFFPNQIKLWLHFHVIKTKLFQHLLVSMSFMAAFLQSYIVPEDRWATLEDIIWMH